MTPEERLQKLQRLKELQALKAGQQVNPIAAGLVGVGQALTFNAIPRLYAAGETAVQNLTGQEGDYSSNLRQAQATEQRIAEQQPIPYYGAQIAGGLLGGQAIGATKAGQAISGMLGTGSIPARIAKAGVAGGVGGAAYGAGGAEIGEVPSGAAIGGLLGAGIGSAIPAVPALAKSAINVAPETKALAKKAVDKFQIPLNARQVTNSKMLKRVEDISQNIPLSGSAEFRDLQLTKFNQAVSGTFGQNIDTFTQDAWDKAFKEAGKPFNDILSGKQIPVDQAYIQQIDDIVNEASQTIDPSKVEIIKNNADKLKEAILNKQEVSGELLNSMRSTLSKRSRTADWDARPYISDLNNIVVDISSAGDPQIKKSLSEASKNYKNLNVALSAWDSTSNAINPVKLENAVKSSRGYGMQSYAKGKAGDLGELAQIGKTFLGEVGGSSTVPNIVAGGLGTAGIGSVAGLVDPTLGLTALGAVGLNRLAQGVNRNPRVVNALLQQQNQLPALYQSGIKTPILSGQLGGMLGAQ